MMIVMIAIFLLYAPGGEKVKADGSTDVLSLWDTEHGNQAAVQYSIVWTTDFTEDSFPFTFASGELTLKADTTIDYVAQETYEFQIKASN